MLESRHPYENNANVYTPVRVPGARALLVSFDEAVTEAGYDFVQFFRDASLRTWCGDEKYSGVSGDGNWPGLGGRPPLEISGDNFVFHFQSDGSTAMWGYRMRVRAAAEPTGTSVAVRRGTSVAAPSSSPASLRVGGTCWSDALLRVSQRACVVLWCARADTVRVRPGVTPAHGWGGARASVGTLVSVDDGTARVNFPEQMHWIGGVRELESSSPQLQCPRGHAVTIVEHGSERPRPYDGVTYTCDVCRRSPRPPLPRMHCNTCQFDMCDSCAQRAAVFAGRSGTRVVARAFAYSYRAHS